MTLKQIAWAMTIALKAFSFYFLIIALFAWKRPRPYPKSRPRTRFACLIAARNEEAVIGALVESLRAQSYPAALYDIYVIPNNCTDDTEGAARAAGAQIFRCFEPVRCKGDALHEAVSWLLPRGYDAFCVFDADNLVHQDFLSHMNDAFCAGARVAKARMRVKNPGDSWVAGCYGLYFALFDMFFNRPRAALGLSAKLVGTGFAVHREVLLRQGGWNTETIAEDAEFAAQCACRGERVWWVSEALTFDEAPASFRVSLTQRLRWCSGIQCVAREKLGDLVRALGRADEPRVIDMMFFLCAPFVQVLSLVPGLLLFLDALLCGMAGGWMLFLAGSLLLVGAGMIVLAAAAAVSFGYRGRGMIKSVLLFPLFMASWLPLQTAALAHPVRSWRPIRHSRALRVGEMAGTQQ
ncbi:MAG: glycosyltransferase family 2 protein [Oscillospiraceae bacterium]|nr:glycosyltransferase family 2 protein [Oscillospiraceae bacterium]